MKRIYVFFSLSVLVTMLVAACGQSPTPQAIQETTPEQIQEIPLQEDVVDVVEIVYMRQAEASPFDLELVEEFNNTHPHIRVIVDNTPAAENYTKLALTTEAGNPPDVYMTYWTVGAASNGLAYDLTPFIEKEGEDWFNSFVEPAWTFNEFGGRYYGISFRIAPVSIIVNKNMFEKAGIDLPPHDWTWEDFLETARKLTNEEAGEYGFCISGSAESHGTDAQFYPFLYSNGGRMIGDDGLVDYNSPEGIEALQWMVDLVEAGDVVPPGTASASNNTCLDLIAADKVAMWNVGSLWLGFIRAGVPDINITVATMPRGVIASTDNGGTGLGMAAKTKHPEEAWEFLKFMSSDDVMKRWAMAADFVPGNKKIITDPEFLANPENATVVHMLENYKIWPLSHYPDNANLEGKLRVYLQAAYVGRMTPKEALDAAAEEWNTVLRDWQSEDWWEVWKE